MPRPDAHAQEYEHPVYENRGNGDQAHFVRDYGAQIRDYISRDAIRDSVRDVRDGGMRDSLREYSPHDFSTSTFYNSSQPSTYAGDRRPTLTSNLPAGPGFSSFVAPRMVNSPQAIGVELAIAGRRSRPHFRPRRFPIGSPPREEAAASLHKFNQTYRPCPPLPPAGPYNDREVRDARELYLSRQLQHQQSSPLSIQLPPAQPPSLPSPNNITPSSRSTLWWGELEPWMDEEYAKQVCTLMGWDPVNIKVPRPAPDPITGQQANNPGYCFLTFPTQSHAASVLSQINNSNNGNGASVIMPNSTKPFSLNWASSVPLRLSRPL
ncbi:putative RNA-binding protein C23E6.01c [Grifola frondosa]|uniref:Putative RNA-binding protein C23E6.01c n=1 Tax=Grifola frondosa TaxID=5627 RepID=A0A1C7M0E7_GRIFR|nr:putative RNA-binding protein C23E6.01c [Grifola frondosa]